MPWIDHQTCEELVRLDLTDEKTVLDLAVEALNEMIEEQHHDFEQTTVEYALFQADIIHGSRCILCRKYSGDGFDMPCMECPLSIKTRGSLTKCYENGPGVNGILATWNHLRATDKKAAKRYMINVTQMVMEYDQ